tara:strand:+ start:2106 stop:3557 length:1452 start_codon:yes stop_codon:yes gene_type:complete
MSVRKSLLISFGEKYTVLLISIASTMILARLLSPAEIGIFSVSVAVVGIAQMVRDFGVTQYLIVERDLTRDRIRAAFGITIVISWSLAAVLYFGRDTLADFYSEPKLHTALSVLCFNFILIPFGNPVLSLLRRDMAFGTLFRINTLTAIIRESTAVGLAFGGFGFMSLVWGSFAGVAATAALATLARPSQAWVMPGFREWRRVLKFGLPASATAFVSEIGASTADLALGRIQGFAEVGLYSRAMGLVNLFHQNIMSAVRWVSLPAFAADERDGKALEENYLKSVGYVTAVAWPFYGFLCLMAFPIIRILFGDQWDESVPLVRILAIAGMIGATWNLAGQVLLVIGLVRKVFWAEVIIQSARVLLIIAAAFHSLELVAWAQVVTYSVGFSIYQFYLGRNFNITLVDVFRAVWKSLLAAIFSVVGPALVVLAWGLTPDNLFLSLFAASLAAAVGWLAGLFIVNHPMRIEIQSLIMRKTKSSQGVD